MYKNDWQDFIYHTSWFIKKQDIVQIGKTEYASYSIFKPSEEFEIKYPTFKELLCSARVTEIRVNSDNYYLFGWTNNQGESFGWLCLPSDGSPTKLELHQDHLLLISSFGGIIEKWNEPEDSWILNYDSVLCSEKCSLGFNGGEEYIHYMCEDHDVSPLIKSEEYISFAFEANGNSSIYHRESGKVLMFAPDHCFDFITPLEGFPEYTLYKFNDCTDFRGWVEHIASQYLVAKYR